MRNKRLLFIIIICILLLLIPLIVMQFTEEVQWAAMDFLVAGILLLGAGLIFDLILRKITNHRSRVTLILLLILVFILIWLELAVGILGTPISGQ